MSIRAPLSTPHVQTGTLYFVALLREELGRRIKTARVAAGMSQRELATAIGLQNAQDVSRYERGVQQVPDYRIDLIAEATGRPRSYFVRDPAEPEPATQETDIRAQVVDLRVKVDALLRHFGVEIPLDEAASRARQTAKR